MLDAGGCFVDLTKPIVYDMFREYALHTFLSVTTKTSFDVETISFLLDRGASVDQRDDAGQTCMHVIFQTTWTAWYDAISTSKYVMNVRDALIFLIQRGADVYATDNNGRSVSDTAYVSNAFDGSSAGDIWDCALMHCGFDINQFRKGHPRQARYSSLPYHVYSRRAFEALWAGRENDCPYYDDEFLPWGEDSDDWEAMSDATSSDSEDGGTYLDEDEEEDHGVEIEVTSGD
jgi:hypothetical protein